MKLLGAGCTMPIGAYARIKDGMMTLYVTNDGQNEHKGEAPAEERFSLAERMAAGL